MKLTIILVLLTILLCACGVGNPPVRRNPYYKVDAIVATCNCEVVDFNHVAQLAGMSFDDMLLWAELRGYEVFVDSGRLAVRIIH